MTRPSIGKKVVAEIREITMRSVTIGQEWGKQQTAKLIEKLKADGYKPPTR